MKKFARRTVIFLVTTILLSSFNVFAITDSVTGPRELSIKEVINNVDYQIASYVEYDDQGKGRGIHAGRDVIPLYDIEESILAYIVPLFDSNKIEIGYMISSAYADGSLMCELSLDNVLASDFRNILGKDDKLTYLSLMNFGLKVTDSINSDLFYSIDINGIKNLAKDKEQIQNDIKKSPKDSECFVNINREKAKEFSECVRKSKSHRNSEASILANDSASLFTTTINYSVVDTCFWSLIDNPANTYYGGDQSWWTDGRENYGCGSVAGANIMAYYDKWHGLTSLYTPADRSKANYIIHMNRVEAYLDASFGGIATLNEFANGVQQYSSTYGYPVYAYWNSQHANYPATMEGYSSYVIDGLANGYPVAYLQWSGYYSSFNWHWMTITKYFQNTDGRWIAISSWGERYSLDFALVSNNAVGGGFLYFTY